MLEKDKLRKTDVFTGGIFFLFGLWIVSRALRMPMKDSWGGVQNVWFVSPALFPLFVGAMISILGVLLTRTAVKAVGWGEVLGVLGRLVSPELVRFLKKAEVIRFYAITILFFSFVYLNLPRIDFFLCSILFLAAFITMFYFDDDALLLKLLFFYVAGTLGCLVYFLLGLPQALKSTLPFPNDWPVVIFISCYQVFAWILVRGSAELRKKYRTSLVLSIVPPFLICPLFKYYLLVPMPTEGLVTSVLDAILY